MWEGRELSCGHTVFSGDSGSGQTVFCGYLGLDKPPLQYLLPSYRKMYHLPSHI